MTIIYMTQLNYKQNYGEYVDAPTTSYFNQVSHDWSTLPYTDIAIYDADVQLNCTDEYPDPVFEFVWLGLDIGCDCLGVYTYYVRWPDQFAVGMQCGRNETKYGCI